MKKQHLNLIGLTAFLLSILAIFSFYPGAMTWDSMDQLRQARAGEYSDWQPPAMAFVWSWLIPLIDGPGGMLLLHCGFLWATGLILYRWCIKEGYSYGIFFLLLPITPWIMNFQFTIWKDVGMAYSWGLATAICLYYKNNQTFPKPAALLIFVLFLYGSSVRSNSLSAGIFLIPFFANTIFKINNIKSTLASMIVGCLVISLAHFSVAALLGAKKSHSVSYVMFDDIVALKLRGVDVPVSFLDQEKMSSIEQCDYLAAHEIGAAFCLSDEEFTSVTQEHYPELKAAWIDHIPNNLYIYGTFRANAFLNFIRSPSLPPYYPSEFRVVNPPYDVTSGIRPMSFVERSVASYVNTSAKILSGLFKPYVWIIVSALLICCFQISQVCRGSSLWLLPMSGFSYATSYVLITPATDFRYAYWLILISSLSIAIFLNMHFKRTSEAQ
ncbi:hypothetical protein HBO07_10725 [Pseudomonas proteolytica]|uniref:hypothetical protein n=1 Tax=Pseudomonas proteolytica TaxID=219574 RepID=UPI001474D727|nr:hypothetical protein [Pseudomonas proteolytica]NMZ11753.1 hypothetical protein [Pseudomonas proteolytica]